MSPRRPASVIAVTPGGDITLDMLLGFIAIYHVPEEPVSIATLRKYWTAEGMDPDLIPKMRKPVHAFQDACRSVETRRPAASENGSNIKRTEIKVDEVLENEDRCVYQITRMVRDKEHEVIDHKKSMTLVFDKLDETISVVALKKAEYEPLAYLEDAIREHFERNSTKVKGGKVRNAIRATLDEFDAQRVVRHGVYFVPRAGHSTLTSLQDILNNVYGENSSAELRTIPCANDEAERKMVAKHFTANASEAIDRLMAEIGTYLNQKDGEVRVDKLRNFRNERRRLSSSADEYMDLLDTELDLVKEKLSILDDQVEKLYVESGKQLED